MPFDEQAFQQWYKQWADVLQLNPNPDHPEHEYDYRAAYQAGAQPSFHSKYINPQAGDTGWHWPSEFKKANHKNRYVFQDNQLIDTITGLPVRAPVEAPPRADSPPAEFLQWLSQRSPESQQGTLDAMKSMMPDAASEYMRTLVHP